MKQDDVEEHDSYAIQDNDNSDSGEGAYSSYYSNPYPNYSSLPLSYRAVISFLTALCP
jgi:hypothetical protein